MNTHHILLVEDNRDDVDLVKYALALSQINIDIEVTSSGEEALATLQAIDNPVNLPRLILLDLKLPKMNGLEVLRMVRGQPKTHTLPIIMFTTSDDRKDITQSIAFGATAYVCKPLSFELLIDFLKQIERSLSSSAFDVRKIHAAKATASMQRAR